MAEAQARSLEDRAAEIAIQVCGGRPKRCYGWKARIFNSAYEAALRALGSQPF